MNSLQTIVKLQKIFFNSGITKDITFKKNQLKKLKNLIIKNKDSFIASLAKDLFKPQFESITGELAFICNEIDYAITHLHQWCTLKKTTTPYFLFPAQSSICPNPYGIVAIIAPWNFPLQLTLVPLIGSIAAGNCTIIKPSEFAPATASLLATLIQDYFDPSYITIVQGDSTTSTTLLQQPLDYIFFTGSTPVGKIVMQAAAQQLIPITLELGGKNPCIVTPTECSQLTAKKIIWGKCYNAGQNCLAPDYLLVHASIKEKLIEQLIAAIKLLYGTNQQVTPDYGRIINEKHINRLTHLLHDTTIRFGGTIDKTDRYVQPTIVDEPSLDHPIMQEEIFGPLLPIVTYDTKDEAVQLLQTIPKPLATYLFSTNQQEQNYFINTISSGSICINDVVVQATNPALPFGGFGLSGMGRYHGRYSFNTFSYPQAIMKQSSRFSLANFRFPPYQRLAKWIEKFFLPHQ